LTWNPERFRLHGDDSSVGLLGVMEDLINCGNCGAEVQRGHRFCGACGAPSAQVNAVTEADDALTADPETEGFGAKLVRIHGGGGDGTEYSIGDSSQFIGRKNGEMLFPDDGYISPRHAEFFVDGQRLFVRDEDSLNGIFLRIKIRVPLVDGDVFMAGEELLRVELGEPRGVAIDGEQTHFFGSPRPQSFLRVRQLLEGGTHGLCHYVDGLSVTVGREGTDLEFPNDRFISGRHCAVERDEDEIFLVDCDSRNGTYLKVQDTTELRHGDFVFVGRQLLRVELTGASRRTS